MPWKWRTRKDKRETFLSIGNISHHTVDPGVGASNKKVLVTGQRADRQKPTSRGACMAQSR